MKMLYIKTIDEVKQRKIYSFVSTCQKRSKVKNQASMHQKKKQVQNNVTKIIPNINVSFKYESMNSTINS